MGINLSRDVKLKLLGLPEFTSVSEGNFFEVAKPKAKVAKKEKRYLEDLFSFSALFKQKKQTLGSAQSLRLDFEEFNRDGSRNYQVQVSAGGKKGKATVAQVFINIDIPEETDELRNLFKQSILESFRKPHLFVEAGKYDMYNWFSSEKVFITCVT